MGFGWRHNPGMDIPKTSEQGGWRWVLATLLLTERAIAWGAFALSDETREIAAWEQPFWLGWGAALLVVALPALLARHRAASWLSGLSGLALVARACVPLLGEKPAAGAVVALMVASATLTFAFLYEQSFWPTLGDPGP